MHLSPYGLELDSAVYLEGPIFFFSIYYQSHWFYFSHGFLKYFFQKEQFFQFITQMIVLIGLLCTAAERSVLSHSRGLASCFCVTALRFPFCLLKTGRLPTFPEGWVIAGLPVMLMPNTIYSSTCMWVVLATVDSKFIQLHTARSLLPPTPSSPETFLVPFYNEIMYESWHSKRDFK